MYVKATNTQERDFFGDSIALSSDDTLVVGAPEEDSASTGQFGKQSDLDNYAEDAGAVYAFPRIAGIWSALAYVKASNTGAGDRFSDPLP